MTARDRLVSSILVQFGLIQPSHNAVLMCTKGETQLNSDLRSWSCVVPPDGLLRTPRRLRAIQGPGNCLKQSGLTRAVRPYDCRESQAKHNFRVRMLAEVCQTEAMELHLD